MSQLDYLAHVLGYIAVGAPVLLVMVLGIASVIDLPFGERGIKRLVQSTVVAGLISSIGVLVIMLTLGSRHVSLVLGNWLMIPHFHFMLKFVFDRLSVPFVILSYVLCGTIGAFASRYMHREPGYNRFFVLYAVFLMGMIVTALAGTIETMFAGWELVGVSSALLVAFYQERLGPARNGLRVWVVYRVSDAALLIAAVVLHHLTGEGDFDALMGQGAPWPFSHCTIAPQPALIVGMLLLVAAAGKSALVPFSGWLPRAMEGPTPSSAVFYGALSVHLGAYLLLRVSPILELSPVLCAAVVAIGLLTAWYATVAGRAQTDIKCALSFASLTQVGIIVAEIGWGLRYIALAHMIGHACFRTLQFLRAPSLLYDYHKMENAVGGRLPRSARLFQHRDRSVSVRAYRFALERGHLDTLLDDYLVRPFVAVFRGFDSLERRWTALLAGSKATTADRAVPVIRPVDELL